MRLIHQLLGVSLLIVPVGGLSQGKFEIKQQALPNPDNEPAAVFPVPSERQMKWQETEFYAFFHYGMNTYTNREWGLGSEDEKIFAPLGAPNPEQWLKVVKTAGMKGGIAVVKHHDGFCLWPTETTGHSILKAGNDYGRNTNIPRDFAEAARKLGMKYGFYVSPWDRNNRYYGTEKYVDQVFLRQCAELAQYGKDQFEMWFDGANGGDGYYGGRNTTVSVDRSTYYDIPNLRDSIHKVCPDIILWGGGKALPDVSGDRGQELHAHPELSARPVRCAARGRRACAQELRRDAPPPAGQGPGREGTGYRERHPQGRR